MRRIILCLSFFSTAATIGCSGDDKHAGNILIEPSGGATGRGGKTSIAGAAGRAGSAGRASTGGKAATSGGNSSGGAGGKVDPTSAGEAGQAGAAGNATAGASGAVNLPSAPVVTFIRPPSVLDPNAIGVIQTESVTVACKAVAASTPGSTVDAATAKITMSQFGDPLTAGQASSLMVNGAREVEFAISDLSGVRSGIVTFDCTAEDNSNPALLGKAESLNLLVDRGPIIDISQPSKLQNIALVSGVDVAFTIGTLPIADGDLKYPLDKVTITINGKAVAVAESAPGSGLYSGHVSLTDPTVFPPGDKPDGPTTLQVVTSNLRGTTVQKTVTFNVDSTPPTIAIQSPIANSIIGKSTTVKFTVKDDGSGVDESTVGVRINIGQIFYYTPTDAARWSHVPGTAAYEFTFSDSDFPGSETQATLSLFAADKVHNAVSPGATTTLFVDTSPPYISLDPPTVRELNIASANTTGAACSTAFDPVGDAINDLTIDNGVDVFRALVWDFADQPRDPNLLRYFAGVDQKNVAIYLQESVDQPLLVDSDGDGFCDNVDIGTGESRKVALKLDPVPVSGNAPNAGTDALTWAEADDTRYGAAPALEPVCQRDGFVWPNWASRCGGASDMVRTINHSVDTKSPIPAVYAIAPQGDMTADVGCTGTYWEYFHDMKRTVTDGWLCFVGVAYDAVGNRGVSAPLRICYDDPNTPAVPTCAQTKLPLDKTWHTIWNSYIAHGVNDAKFRDKSAETPPTCAKSCKLIAQEPIRYVANQKH